MSPELAADCKDTLEYADQIEATGQQAKAKAEADLSNAYATIAMATGVREEARRRITKKMGLVPGDTINFQTFEVTRAAPPTESAKHEQPPTP